MRIGRFEVAEELGRGGMGVVYRAWDPVIGRAVAIKKLTQASEVQLERFRQEAFAAGRLQHPNITTLYESGETAGEPYLVMEYLDGESLKAAIQSRRLPPLVERLRLVAEVARGLDHAHLHGVVVHRDIKPANIQITASGQAKVMDFGIAKLADELQLARSLTEANTVLGTLFYMSPEQIRGEELDGRSDIWSLGVVLWELLWGNRPFEDEDDNETMKKVVLEELPEPPRLGIHDEEELVRIVRRTLEKERTRRFPRALELARELEGCAQSMATKADRPVVARVKTAEEHFHDGHQLYALEEYGRAAESFRRALELAPHSRPAQHNLEICVRELSRKRAGELYRLGMLLFKNREYGVAVSALEELLVLEPGHDDARTLIVWARRELTRRSERGALDSLVESTLEGLLASEQGRNPATLPPGSPDSDQGPAPTALAGESERPTIAPGEAGPARPGRPGKRLEGLLRRLFPRARG